MTTTAKIILDSISPAGVRLVTMELRFPRFLLAQFNTHRVFSRNAQSSRAIPVEKLIQSVIDDPVVPYFGRNQKGMQAKNEEQIDAKADWVGAMSAAIHWSKAFADKGVHKQTANRLLEPFAHVTVLVSSTEWENFFALRLHHAAQPEMQDLAREMWVAIEDSEPHKRTAAQWHLPFLGKDDCLLMEVEQCMVSAARCARVSYRNHDQSAPNWEKDLELAQRLMKDKHLSPFEHQARAMDDKGYMSGNFQGWYQFRKGFEHGAY